MSVDTGANGLAREVTLAAALTEVPGTLQRLLGAPEPPLLLARHRLRTDGYPRWIDGGAVSAREARELRVGGAEHYVDVGVVGVPYPSWTVWGSKAGDRTDFFMVMSPKSDLGILTSMAIALTVAILGEGSYWDSLYFKPVWALLDRPAQIVETLRVEPGHSLDTAAGLWLQRWGTEPPS